jgi:hypothetical protein
MISRVTDLGTERLKKLASNNNWQKIAKTAALETISEIVASNKPDSNVLQGVAASEYLEKIIPSVEAAILSRHSAYSDLRWLWYLRRIPRELLTGSLRTTFPYDLALAETISWQMPKAKIGSHLNQLHYPVDEHVFRHLCRFVGRVKMLSDLHGTYRSVGKGATLKIESGIPVPNTEKNVDEAIQIYDLRHETTQGGLGAGLGLSPLEADYSRLKELNEKDDLHFVLTPSCSPVLVPVTYPDDKGKIVEAEVDAQYFMSIVEIEKVLDPYQDQLEIEPNYLQEIVPIFQFQYMLFILIANIPWAIGSMLKQGYFLTKIDIARNLFDHYLPKINSILGQWLKASLLCDTFDAWLEAASLIVPKTWPLKSGGFVGIYNEAYVLFNTASATNAMFGRMEVDKSLSILGNKRGSHFESQCQEIINNTIWIPGSEIAAMRGRTLRRNGRAVTDIDAIGTKGKTLLLISCKSVVYDSDYDLGKYSTIRNVQSTIDIAVEYWLNLIDSLKANPVGENFDFSDFDRIYGVVCTPFAVYSDSEQTLSFVDDGLRACLSSSELETWLAT